MMPWGRFQVFHSPAVSKRISSESTGRLRRQWIRQMQVILNIIAMFYQLWASWIGVILVAYSRRVISGELRELAFLGPPKQEAAKPLCI